jgi:hypothetical protein
MRLRLAASCGERDGLLVLTCEKSIQGEGAAVAKYKARLARDRVLARINRIRSQRERFELISSQYRLEVVTSPSAGNHIKKEGIVTGYELSLTIVRDDLYGVSHCEKYLSCIKPSAGRVFSHRRALAESRAIRRSPAATPKPTAAAALVQGPAGLVEQLVHLGLKWALKLAGILSQMPEACNGE